MRGTIELTTRVRGPEDRFVAAIHGRRDVARGMLRRTPALGFATATWGETALQAASHLGQCELLCDLVNSGVHVDLFAACAMGDTQAAKRLLGTASRDRYGVHGLPLLHFGVVSGDGSMLEMLIAEGAPINPRSGGLPPLHSAVAVGWRLAVDMLLSSGADESATDALGETALQLALTLDGPRSAIVGMLRTAAAYHG